MANWTEEEVQPTFSLPATVRPEVLMAIRIPVSDHPRSVKGLHPTVHPGWYGQDWSHSR